MRRTTYIFIGSDSLSLLHRSCDLGEGDRSSNVKKSNSKSKRNVSLSVLFILVGDPIKLIKLLLRN